MKLKGKVKKIIQESLNEGRVLHFSLFDPDKVNLDTLYSTAKKLVEAGTNAFLIGGTLGISSDKLDKMLEILEDFEIPKILFPNNVSSISEKADAILFMSLLNSDDIYYVIGAQLIAAPIVKRLNLEVLPTGYLIIGHGMTAAHVGRARVIPYEQAELIAAYALMAEYLGMNFVYLEAGSGAPEPVKPSVLSTVRRYVDNIKLIVGGGIKSEAVAKEIALAGADIIVTGNIIEQDVEKALKIIRQISNIRR